MRWQEAVGHRQCSRHWYTNIQQWNIRGSRDGKHQRQHQHETHFIEQGKTNGKTGQYHRPLDVFFTKFGNQCGSDTLCATAVCQHFAQHRTKTHDQGKATERSADTSFDGANNFIQRHPLH